MKPQETRLRNLQIGAVSAISGENCDVSLLYAYSQIAPETPLEHRASVAWRNLEKQSPTLSLAAIREIMRAQNLPFPEKKMWLFTAGELGDRRFFKNHAANLLYLRHPNLALIYDARYSGETGDTPTSVLEALEEFAPVEWSNLSAAQKVANFPQILDAVRFLHSQNFCHGDLRPDNLWFSGDRAKLLNTGIVPNWSIAKNQYFSPALFGYAAPELLATGGFNFATEIYALGACLYFLASGAHPFATAAGLPAFLQMLEDHTATLPAEIPPRLANIIGCAMSSNAAERYGSVEELAVDLGKFLRDEIAVASLALSTAADKNADKSAMKTAFSAFETDLFDQPEPQFLHSDSVSATDEDADNFAAVENRRRVMFARRLKKIGIAAAIFAVFFGITYLLSRRQTPKIDQTSLMSLTAADADDVGEGNHRNEVFFPQNPSQNPSQNLAQDVQIDPLDDALPTLDNSNDLNLNAALPTLPTLDNPNADFISAPIDIDVNASFPDLSPLPLPANSEAADSDLPALHEIDAASANAPSVASLSPAARLVAEAHELMRNKDYAEALAKYEQAAKLNPPTELADEISSLTQAAKISLARQEADAALRKRVNDLLAAKNFTEAENALTEALATKPDGDEELERSLATARVGRFGEAFAEGEKHLAAQEWEAADLAYGWALSVDGFAENPDALAGREKAQRAMAEIAETAANSADDNRSSFTAALTEANNLLAKKNYHAAIEVFDLALGVPGFADNPEALQGKRFAEAAARDIADGLPTTSVEPIASADSSPTASTNSANVSGDARRQYAELMDRGRKLLTAGAWSDSERVFSRALTVPGFAGDQAALAARQQAISGQIATNQQEQTYSALIAALRSAREHDYRGVEEKLATAEKTADDDRRQLISLLRQSLAPANDGGAASDGRDGNATADLFDQLTAAENFAEQKQYAASASAFLQCANIAENPAPLRWAAGLMNALAEDAPAAQDDFRQALTADPNFSPAVFGQALLAIKAGAYQNALPLLENYRQSVNSDFDRANVANAVGYLYYDGGLGITEKRRQMKVSNERAAGNFEDAANLGDLAALNNFAVCLLTGRGVHRDYDHGREVLARAGDFPTALFNRGLMYFRGTGISRDYAQAADFFLRSATLGDRRAAARLADMYQRGRGVAKDDGQVKKWLTAAGGELDRDDEFALALPDFYSQFSQFKNFPRPTAKRNEAAPSQDFSPAYQWLTSAANRQLNDGRLIAASRNFALALQLPGYLDDAVANQGLTNATARVQDLIFAASAPLPNANPNANPAAADLSANDLNFSSSSTDSVSALSTSASTNMSVPKSVPGEPTAERKNFYRQTLEEGRKMLAMQNWGYAEQAFQLALIIPGIADEAQAVDGLNKALEAKRRLADQIKFTDFEAVLSNATSQLRDKQWLAGAYLYKYALTLPETENDTLPQIGLKIAEYEQAYQQSKPAVISAGSEKDMASYNLALTQAKNFIDENKFDAAAQLLKNVLQWDDFKGDPVATALLKMAQDKQDESEKLPEFLAQQREKNKELYEKLIFSGKVYLQEKNWTEADRAFQLAQKLKGYENDAAAKRGIDAAAKKQAEVRANPSPQVRAEFLAMLAEARDALKIGNYAKAEELARAALKLPNCQDDADGVAMLESACQAQGKPMEINSENPRSDNFALTEAERENATKAAEYQAMVGEGRRSFEMGQYDVAEVIFREIVKMPGYQNDPAALEFLHRIGQLKPRQADVAPPTPESTAELSGEDNVEQSRLLFNEGRRALAAKRYDAAAQFFSNSIDLNPQQAEAFYQRGSVKLAQGQLEIALTDLQKAVEIGGLSAADFADCQNSIANIYCYGQDKNYDAAFKHYQEAANAGSAAAMNSLGVAYFVGRGTAENKSEAIGWYRRAADAGYGNAMLNLGLNFDNGWTGDVDYAQARQWYEKAATKNIPRAFARLARLYREGLGVEKDETKSTEYRAQAQALGYTAEK